MKHHPGCKHIIWANHPGINGYGDALNRLSYYYRQYENDIVYCSYRDKLINWQKVNFIRRHVLQRNSNFLINCTQDRLFTRETIPRHFAQPRHEYWPARITHDAMPSGKIAFHFYRNNFPTKYQSKLNDLEFHSKVYSDNLENLRNELYWAGYELVSLYDVDDYHGFKVMTNPIDCIRANMYILQECDWYVGSEGFMAHVARAMRVPGLLYRNDPHSLEYRRIENTLEQPIHHMVSNSKKIKKILDISSEFANI